MKPVSDPAPVVLFAYRRPHELRNTIAALQANHLARQSELHVFVDGPKHPFDIPKVTEVQRVVAGITGFRKVFCNFAERNKGLAASIIGGVSQILRQHDRVIVLEDDILTAPNFLNFINQGLSQYERHPRVFSIGGYTFPFGRPANYAHDVYFYGRTCAWGWGIWADRWSRTDWSVADFDSFMADPVRRQSFNYYGSDRVRMLRRTLEGELDTWDIRLCYEQFKRGQLTVYPVQSKTENIGFQAEGSSHTNVFNRYRTVLDPGVQHSFVMPEQVAEHPHYTRLFRQRFSLGTRLVNRLKTVAGLR